VGRNSKPTQLNSIILLNPPSNEEGKNINQTLKDEIEYLKKMVDKFLEWLLCRILKPCLNKRNNFNKIYLI
jgi:hypothetical protein